MDHLASQNIKYPEILESGEATHIIAGITYGANAFFRFEKSLSENETKKDVGGSLEIEVKKIPSFNISGDGKVDINEEDKKRVNNVKCEFYGDYTGIHIPTSFEDAVRVLAQLSSDENLARCVPITVSLTPLHSLDSRACQLVREISEQTVDEAAKIKMYFDEVLEKVHHLMEFKTVKYFALFKEYLESVQISFKRAATQFKASLAKTLPRIRGRGEDENELLNLIGEFLASKFSKQNFVKWYEQQEDELKTLDMILAKLETGGITVTKNNGEFRRETMNEKGFEGTFTFILDFCVKRDQRFLVNYDTYQEKDSWLEEFSFFESIVTNIDLLIEAMDANPQHRVVAFLRFASEINTCSINFLQKGKCIHENMDLETELKNMSNGNETDDKKCENGAEEKHLVVIGSTGTGKSTICNILAGKDPNDSTFPVSGAMESHTNKTTARTVLWRGDAGLQFTLIDTPGLNDPEPGKDERNSRELMSELKKLKHINVFLIVFNGSNPRFDNALIKMMKVFQNILGKEFLEKNTVFEFTNWAHDRKSVKRRGSLKNENYWMTELNKRLQAEFGSKNVVPAVFIDSLYDKDDLQEKEAFEKELAKLKSHLTTFPAYQYN